MVWAVGCGFIEVKNRNRFVLFRKAMLWFEMDFGNGPRFSGLITVVPYTREMDRWY
ncbi:hypothetical protein HanXRQr2_Chr06g0263561 [Helianthus annuus]|uniref:Uncharacterized protein n=1 Tax=Helianthus annuus TaxID=4232 RepID=A0A9K3ITM5_HELAN|nr:hypothetical protein HanXRQr2_Chr06g0263561 [Helianthus annuus]